MSATTAVTSLSSAPTTYNSAIMVGDARISALIAETLTKMNVRVETDPLCETIRGEYVFGRDSRVILSDGTHLVPYPIQDLLLEGRFKALLPESSDHIITGLRLGYGNGFSQENVAGAHKTAKALNIPAAQATTCIEGGNCFITENGAIAGIHSVILSLIALEEQGLFHEEILEKEAQEIEIPDSRFLRMARNSALYAEKRLVDEKLLGVRGYSPLREEISKRWGGESGFRSLLTTTLTEAEMREYCEAAKRLQVKWELTLDVMAKELGINKKDLAVVDQNEFHIDMEMALAPDQRLFVHDPKLADSFLGHLVERVSRARKDPFAYYHGLQQSSMRHSTREFATMQRNLPKLTSLGLRVITLPATYNSDVEKINFINGLFLKTKEGSIFLTNGAGRKANALVEEFTRALRGYDIEPIYFDELQEVLTRNHGGLHCLTWTRPIRDDESIDPSSASNTL